MATKPSGGSQTVYRLPRSHWHCTLDNFEWEHVRPKKLAAVIEQFLTTARTGANTHLLLIGEPGVGKSHIGVAAYRWMVEQVGTLQAIWLNVPAFCDKVKDTYSSGLDPWVEYEDVRFAVLDDLFGRELSTHEADRIVYRLLDMLYQHDAAILVTMNQALSELEQGRLPAHELSRLLANHSVVPMTAEQDWRRRKSTT